MSAPNSSSTIRRSKRRSIPTTRSRQYQEQRDVTKPVFPSVRDEIIVKWIVEDAVIWWPAVVLSIGQVRRDGKACHGSLMYQKMGDYEREQAAVIFSSSGPDERFVKTVNSTSSSQTDARENDATWKFADESSSEKEESDNVNEKKIINTVSRKNRPASSSLTASMLASSSAARHAIIKKENSHVKGNLVSVISKQSREKKTRTTRKTKGEDREHRTSSNHSSRSEEMSEIQAEFKKETEDNVDGSKWIEEKAEINNRLRVLERQLQDVNARNSSTLSASLHSVIVSMRWA